MELDNMVVGKAANQQKTTIVRWTKPMEIELEEVVLSLEKHQKTVGRIHLALSKIYKGVNRVSVGHKLKSWKPKNRDLFE